MSLEKIEEKILEEAKQEAEKIIKEAREKVRAAKEEAEIEAKKKYQKDLDHIKLIKAQEEEKVTMEYKATTNAEILGLKNNLLNKVFQQAKKDILNIDNEQYFKFINKYLALNINPDIDTIIISEKDKNRLTSSWFADCKKKIDRKIEAKITTSSEIEGGFILKGKKVEVDCSIEQLLRDKKEELKPKLSKVLF